MSVLFSVHSHYLADFFGVITLCWHDITDDII
ncbi:hypothetical protein SARI_00716 [Salmonella enterica subsp. arizonae serovar 62:z4,z23:-]|uniref:Uncharacterized protein n=1 Tax=Salmonella arizonae (strain ATCC BAA-731 / CDC346-86 / RSK2980) TaxID=41514 RepID=A9MKS4_SALAR|nr:hypothetical protein SARI_00716 [Salmonella enterica subsp. arizonae serovar 62:z4,z23:-]